MLGKFFTVTFPEKGVKQMSSGRLVYFFSGISLLVLSVVCVLLLFVATNYALFTELEQFSTQAKLFFDVIWLGVCLASLKLGLAVVNELFQLADDSSDTAVEAVGYLILVAGFVYILVAVIQYFFGGLV